MENMNPSSVEGESAVLASIIENPKVLHEIGGYLHKSIFYEPKNARLYELLVNMNNSEEPIDLVTICGRLTEADKQSGVDPYFVTSILDNQTSNPLYYARQVFEKYLLRRIIEKTTTISSAATTSNQDVYKLMQETHDMIGRLIEVRPGVKVSISDTMEATMDSIINSDRDILKTGFKEIDDLSGGMTKGEITILGGRPGHGKTTTMINVVKSCMDRGLKCMVFNREMTNVEMMKKLMVLESQKLSYLNVRRGIVGDLETSAELSRIKKVIIDKYSEDRFAMFDNLTSFEQSAAEVRKFKPDIIFDDYLQLISPTEKFDQRRLQLEQLINDYKWLVKSQNCCGFLLSQLNRGLEVRGDGKPKLSDIAESGAIEQVAENVLFVYYDYKVKGMASKLGKNQLELVASKVRYGNSGNAILRYEGDKVKIGE